MTDDPIGDALRREFASSAVPYDAAHVDNMLATVRAAGSQGPRWAAPLAAAAVVAVVGGGAAVIGLPHSHHGTPAGGGGPAASPSSTAQNCDVRVFAASGSEVPLTGVAVPPDASASYYYSGAYVPMNTSAPASLAPASGPSASATSGSGGAYSSVLCVSVTSGTTCVVTPATMEAPVSSTASDTPASSDASAPSNASASSDAPASSDPSASSDAPASSDASGVPGISAAYVCGEQGYAPLPTTATSH